MEFPWRSNALVPGAQVDLVIERSDKITYVCEMKFTNAAYALSSTYREKLLHKVEAFKAESGTRNAVQIVMVCAAGFRRTPNADIVAYVVEGDDLFV